MNQFIIKFLVVVSFVAVGTYGAAVHSQSQSGEESQNGRSISDISPEFAVIQKVYDDCHDTEDFVKCLKGKALNGISRAIEQVRVINFISFKKIFYDKSDFFLVDSRTPFKFLMVSRW